MKENHVGFETLSTFTVVNKREKDMAFSEDGQRNQLFFLSSIHFSVYLVLLFWVGLIAGLWKTLIPETREK